MGVGGVAHRAVANSRRRVCGFLVPSLVVLTFVLLLASAAKSSMLPPEPLAAPTLDACSFIPDPRSNVSYDCWAPPEQAAPAFANISIAFEANVSGTAGDQLNVTFFFDYFQSEAEPGVLNPESPYLSVFLTPLQDGVPMSANVTWTYPSPNANFSDGRYWVYIQVQNEAGEIDQSFGYVLLPVFVVYNSPPYLDGLLSLNSISQSVKPADPQIPLVYENVTVGDADADSVVVTWDWADGTATVNRTVPLVDPLELRVTHRYEPSFLPLNETPRYVQVPVEVWIDDGMGHNSSTTSVVEFYLDFDFPPTVRVDLPLVNSLWKVGETVTMVGNVSDPEGSPTTAYWDFDNRTDSTNSGDPERNVDASGTTTSHAYASPGVYNITLWATDGNRLFCLNVTTCAEFTTHWRKAVIPIQVRGNLPPVLGITNMTTVTGQPTLLRASVYDPDGDNMTVRWVFDDGSPEVTNYTGNSSRTAPEVYEIFQEHSYEDPGLHNYTVFVSDGVATTNETREVFVQSFNLPPVILNAFVKRANGTSATNNTFVLNETLVLELIVYDPENDTLTISVDWADGHYDNRTLDPASSVDCAVDNQSRNLCSLSFIHTYPDIGESQWHNYTVTAIITDGQRYLAQNATGGPPITLNHTKERDVVIYVTNFQAQGLGPWDWWDYSTLAAVVGLPSLLIARFAWKVRRERRED